MNADLLSCDELEKLPLFEGMNETDLHQLSEIAVVAVFEPGENVLRQGKSSQSLFVVLEGQCRVVKQTGANGISTTVLAELGPHDHFGEMSFFHAAPHSASVVAVTPVKLLKIDRHRYDELIEDGAIVAYKLALNSVDVLADRLRRMDEWVTDLLGDDPADDSMNEWTSFREKLFTGGISGRAL